METPYYSPAWTPEQAHREFYKRMLFMFDGFSSPCWMNRPLDEKYNQGRIYDRKET